MKKYNTPQEWIVGRTFDVITITKYNKKDKTYSYSLLGVKKNGYSKEELTMDWNGVFRVIQRNKKQYKLFQRLFPEYFV